jgi:hypothetical protein
MALLAPKRKFQVFTVDGAMNVVEPVDDPETLREAIAFYSVASYVFHRGLYADEEQVPPDRRAAVARPRIGG